MDPGLGASVRKAAARAKLSVSAWIAEAAADRVRNDLLGRALDGWEAEDGAFEGQELLAAADALALGRQRKPRRP